MKKTDKSNENDAPLHALLQEWEPKASPPPGFQEQVWRRIDRAEIAPPSSISLATGFANWVVNMLPKPALAAAYVMVLLVAGGSMGWSQARQETARVTGELSARYAQAVDPHQVPPQP